MLVRIANREDPDQTASSEVWAVCLDLFGRHIVLEILWNALNKLGKIDKMQGLPSISLPFGNEFNDTGVWMLYTFII